MHMQQHCAGTPWLRQSSCAQLAAYTHTITDAAIQITSSSHTSSLHIASGQRFQQKTPPAHSHLAHNALEPCEARNGRAQRSCATLRTRSIEREHAAQAVALLH